VNALRPLGWLAAVLLAGCVAGPYKVPEGAETARLTVTNSSGDPLPLYTFDNAESCAGARSLHPRAGVPMGDSYSLRIAAGAPFTLSAQGTNAEPRSFGTAGGAAPCAVAGTFLPKAGRSYLAIYRAGGGGCSLQVGERAPDAVKYVPEASFRLRTEDNCR
jgi:hypothetical protein